MVDWTEDELKIILLVLLLSRQVRGWGCHSFASCDFSGILLNFPLHFEREESSPISLEARPFLLRRNGVDL